jgi:flagellar basal body-associated protein FliL
MSGRKKARPSFNEYPVDKEQHVKEQHVKEQQHNSFTSFMTEEEPDSDTVLDDEELERRRKRKCIAIILVALCVLILVIVLIAIILSLLGTSDADGGTRVSPECVISNETAPETYEEFECDMIATLTTEESTYLKTFASNTAHGKTIGWMVSEDKTDFSKTPIDVILERYVMALIYYSTVSNA